MAKTSLIYFILLLICSSASGCSGSRIDRVVATDSTYLVGENGMVRRMNCIQIHRKYWAPGEEAGATTLYLLLPTQFVATSVDWYRVANAAGPYHTFSGDRVPNMLHILKSMYKLRSGEQKDLWLISISPVILAEGARVRASRPDWVAEVRNDEVELPDNCHLVRDEDLNEVVTRLTIFVAKVNGPFGEGTVHSEDLPVGTTLKQLFNTKGQ